jgi:O-antigen/teichoic acid export membrane protein
LFKKINKFGISRQISKDFSLLFFANIINNGTNFIANIIIARVFGQEVFGLFSIAVNIALTTLTFSEFGMNLTMVRLYKLYENDAAKSNAVILWNLYFKSVILIILLCLALIFGRSLSSLLTHKTDRVFLITVALITGGMLGFWSYLKAFFQSYNLFKKVATTTLLYAILRMVFLVGLSIHPSSLYTEALFLGVYLLPVSIVVLWGFFDQRDKFHFGGVKNKDLFKMSGEILAYSKWVALSMVAFILIQRCMVFIAAAYTTLEQVAILSAGLLFSAVFNLINDSVRQILFPKIAQLGSGKISEYKAKLKKILPLYIVLSLFIIIGLSVVLYITLGEKYKKSLPIFWITGASTALTCGIGFYNILYHSIMKPIPDTLINIGTLLCLLIAALLAVGKYGIMGIAVSYAIIQLSGEVVKAKVLSRYLKGQTYA